MTRIEELEQSIDESVEKFRLEINKFKAEIEHIKALAELKESKKEKWKPKEGEEYWFRTTDNQIGYRYYKIGCVNDEWRINNIPIFKTQLECEKYWHFMDTVKEKSYEFSKEEWDDDSLYKYHIRYQYYDKKIEVDSYTRTKIVGTIYFKTEEDAQYIIDNFKEELLKYWL